MHQSFQARGHRCSRDSRTSCSGGNVLDLAVAVVVGAAFTAIVTAFTDNIISPLIAAVGGSDDLPWGMAIIEGNDATFVNVGAVVTAIINFVIIAAVVYFVLIVPRTPSRPVSRRRKRTRKPVRRTCSSRFATSWPRAASARPRPRSPTAGTPESTTDPSAHTETTMRVPSGGHAHRFVSAAGVAVRATRDQPWCGGT